MDFRIKDLGITVLGADRERISPDLACRLPSCAFWTCGACSAVASCRFLSCQPCSQQGSLECPRVTLVGCPARSAIDPCGGTITPWVLEVNTLEELQALKVQVRQELGIPEPRATTLAEAEALAVKLKEAHAELESQIAELKKQQ